MMGGMMGGMFSMMFWMVLGAILFIALLVVVIWLLMRWLNTQRPPAAPPQWQQNTREYQQGYSSPLSGMPPQEGERVYHGSSSPYEQPQVEYPQIQ